MGNGKSIYHLPFAVCHFPFAGEVFRCKKHVRTVNRKPHRILMTADTVGGVWTYALELARSLQTYDVEVLLAVMGPRLSSGQREDAQNVSNLNIFKSDYKLEWMPDCWTDVKRAGDWLLHLENRLQPDLVHLNGYTHANLPWKNPTLVAGHSCVFSWWQSVHGDAPPVEWQRYKNEVKNGLRAADLVVTPSAAMLRALNTHYGSIENACVIPNGRNPEYFKPETKQQFILSAGRLWDAAKNINRVAEIASELPWPVFVAGDFQPPQQQAQNDSAARQCRWLGSLSESELRPWFAAAPIYALPALYEPFGYTPLEAALSGCALVLGDIESLREIWRDAAVFVNPNDSEALKVELLALINDEQHRRNMSRRARERALEFTSARMAQNYFSAYSELLAHSKITHEEERFARCA
jgi:glycogen synthase